MTPSSGQGSQPHHTVVYIVEEMSAGTVHFEVRDHAGWITLDRPERRNAIDAGMASAVAAATEHVEAAGDLWVGVLTGTGPVFCAGVDLQLAADGEADRTITAEGGFAGFVRYPRARPWIAAVNGPALAGGFELVLACDLIVATEDSFFSLPEVSRGLVPGAGGMFRLPRSLPKQLALELLVTGSRLDAARSAALGMVNEVVARNELVPSAERLVDRICAGSPVALREVLAVARVAATLDDDEAWRRSRQVTLQVRKSDDAREGPRAFLEKRPPRWSGT